MPKHPTAPRWLDEEEAAAWRSYLLLTQLQQRELDGQLQRDAGMPHAYYGILARLSDHPDSTARVTDLAADLDYSQSRTSHALSRLEEAGWICRRPCPTDRRTTYVVLTGQGRAALGAAAPGHVNCVRASFLDHLTRLQVQQLNQICQAALAHLTSVRPCP